MLPAAERPDLDKAIPRVRNTNCANQFAVQEQAESDGGQTSPVSRVRTNRPSRKSSFAGSGMSESGRCAAAGGGATGAELSEAATAECQPESSRATRAAVTGRRIRCDMQEERENSAANVMAAPAPGKKKRDPRQRRALRHVRFRLYCVACDNRHAR